MLLNHAWATLTVLRESLNCTLPIEIIYNGPLEMDAWSIQTFEVGHLPRTQHTLLAAVLAVIFPHAHDNGHLLICPVEHADKHDLKVRDAAMAVLGRQGS